MHIDEVLSSVARRFGLERLKPKQQEVISTFVQGRDVLVSLPTGYGKSIIYAALPFVYDSIKGMVVLNVVSLHNVHIMLCR